MVVPTALQLINITTPSLCVDAGSSPQCNATVPTGKEESGREHESLAKRVQNVKESETTTSLCTRFSRLSHLLSSILGTVIMYTPTVIPPDQTPSANMPSDLEHSSSEFESVSGSLNTPPVQSNAPNPTLVAAGHVLPPIISALGLGSARFLKGVVPAVADWLVLPIPTPHSSGPPTSGMHLDAERDQGKQSGHSGPNGGFPLHIAALHVIRTLCDTCAPCLNPWAVTIIDCLARCWVGCVDAEADGTEPSDLEALRNCLREVALDLARACPDVIKVCGSRSPHLLVDVHLQLDQNEYACLTASDEALFGALVGNIPSPIANSPP